MLMPLVALQVMAGAALPAPVATSSAPVMRSICEVIAISRGGNVSDLYAACGSTGVWIGQAESYQASYNSSIGSLLVKSRRGSDVRVRFVARDAGGVLHVEDVTRELTKLSGRYVEAGLDGIDVNISNFAADGGVSVPVQGVIKAPEGKAMMAGGVGTIAAAAARTAGSGAGDDSASIPAARLDIASYAVSIAAQRVAQTTVDASATVVVDR